MVYPSIILRKLLVLHAAVVKTEEHRIERVDTRHQIAEFRDLKRVGTRHQIGWFHDLKWVGTRHRYIM